MLIKFTKHDGSALYIRAEDLRSIGDYLPTEDRDGQLTSTATWISWVEGETRFTQKVQGTADDNYARLAEEERARVAAYEAARGARLPDLSSAPVVRLPNPRGRPR